MTDKELLELAAKAAGVTCKGWVMPGAGSDGWWGMYTGSDDDGDYAKWNPLTDDGDALRLAVHLRMHLMHLGIADVGALCKKSPPMVEDYNGDPCAATRRAIVRAAADLALSI